LISKAILLDKARTPGVHDRSGQGHLNIKQAATQAATPQKVVAAEIDVLPHRTMGAVGGQDVERASPYRKQKRRRVSGQQATLISIAGLG
jgi:hypothetical protein